MGIDQRAPVPIQQFEPREGHLDEIWPRKNHRDQVFRRLPGRAGDGKRFEHLCLVFFVILQNGIRRRGQLIAISDIRVPIYRYHVGPSLEIFLFCGRELVLIVVRPAMEIRQVPEDEGTRRWRINAAVLFRLKCAASDGERDEDPERAGFHCIPRERA
ncbi:MAG: hypothetical protein ABI680_14105 [Chthoniobacteraceae bacterium]